ncbi:MAG: hypothetical protein ACJ72D_07550 [Marmoricola sp.]
MKAPRVAVLLVALTALAGCGGAATPKTATTPTRTPSVSATSRGTAAPLHARAVYATWRLPYAISREAVLPVSSAQGSVLLAGGMMPGDVSTAKVLRILLRQGKAFALPSLGVAVHDVAAGTYNDRPALFGGGNATEQSVVQAFNGRKWRVVAHLPTTRSDLSVVELDGSTLIIGGYDGTAVPRPVLTPGPGARFAAIGQLAVGVRYAATAVLGPHVYVFGGEVDHHELSTVQRFDVSLGRTVVVGHLPRPLGHAVAAAVGGRILLIGGRTDPNTQTAAMWWYDPGTRRFTAAGRLPVGTSDSAVVAEGHRIWLLGGEHPQVTDRVIVVHVS